MYAATLSASHAVPWWVTVSTQTGETDGQTDGRQTVTLRFPLDASSQRNKYSQQDSKVL